MSDDKESHIIKQVVPHTHITAGFLSHLAFDCQQLSTPAYREKLKMSDLNLKTCRQTLINWLWRGGEQLNLLIPALKSIALEALAAKQRRVDNSSARKNANTNCDVFCPRCSGDRGGALTWCRDKTAKKYKKHYIWCLCNRAQKTVIFFYDALAAKKKD